MRLGLIVNLTPHNRHHNHNQRPTFQDKEAPCIKQIPP